MSGFVCPECKKITYIFKEGGGQALATKYNLPFLGSIPIDPAIGDAGDDGLPYVTKAMDSPAA
jgi:ATP-binding protein involved in chromosome partitioning